MSAESAAVCAPETAPASPSEKFPQKKQQSWGRIITLLPSLFLTAKKKNSHSLFAKQTYEQPNQHSGRATYQVLWAPGLTQAILAPECRTESPRNMTLFNCLLPTGRYHIWELHVFHAGERKIFGQGQQREGCVSPQAMHKRTLPQLGTNM